MDHEIQHKKIFFLSYAYFIIIFVCSFFFSYKSTCLTFGICFVYYTFIYEIHHTKHIKKVKWLTSFRLSLTSIYYQTKKCLLSFMTLFIKIEERMCKHVPNTTWCIVPISKHVHM